MCGILGGIHTRFDRSSLERLRHRGPDQCSIVHETLEGVGTITLGQTRLNIVDRQDVELPIRIGSSTVLFNGEMYNHLDLRRELESYGWEFATRTDTEVALAAYLHWGIECLQRFNGMFALVVWDGDRFFCARDRMGQKPFFYRMSQGAFEFASEAKAFGSLEFTRRDVSDLFEFCFNEHTLFRDVFSLKPGSYLVYDVRRGTCVTRSYWDVEQQVHHRIEDEDEAVDAFLQLLEDSIRLRVRADVPVSMFLSGGIDSALIAGLSELKEAFTCQFSEFAESINEEEYARDLTERLGMKLNILSPQREEFFHDLPAMGYYLEMPTGSFSVFPIYRLAEAARAAGYKVVLSGEGSDELFAGYARNEFLLADQLDSHDLKRQQYRSMLLRYHGSGLDRFCRMASRSGLEGAASMKAFLTEYWSERRSMLENICYLESRIFLQPLLQMVDRMTMAHSVEARCPYLDHRIVELAFSLHDSLRYRDGVGKWIVHRAAERVLPRGSRVLQRPVKHGLATPVNLWMQGRQSFDRRYWNTILTAECMKSLLGGLG